MVHILCGILHFNFIINQILFMFCRGRGPLKTTMDVINAAKKISEAGTKLDKLSRQIADQCPESRTKDDMLAYLDRIALYCHQLNITSKVKADVQNISGELIVSGVSNYLYIFTSLLSPFTPFKGASVTVKLPITTLHWLKC